MTMLVTSGLCDKFNKVVMNTTQELIEASKDEATPQLREMAQYLASLPLQPTALHYADAHDALWDADDPLLKVFADLIELRLLGASRLSCRPPTTWHILWVDDRGSAAR